MKLTNLEKGALLEDIANDIPKGCKLFSPWISLWMISFLLLLIGSGFFGIVISDGYFGSSVLAYFLISPLGLFGLLFINHLFIVGKVGAAKKWIDTMSIILASSPILAYVTSESVEMLAAWLSLFVGLSVLMITRTIRFQVFCLHRKRMGEWGVERMRKNKAFRDKIKKTRKTSSF